jgi:hypothetical protein
LLFFLIFTLSLAAQKVSYHFTKNDVDSDTKEVMELLENYLTSAPQNQSSNVFWNSEDQERYQQYDFLEDEFQPSLYMGLPAHVLSIEFYDGIAKIKVQYGTEKSDGNLNILAIVNYYAQKEKGTYKLHNALSVNKKKWKCTSVGIVDFYYPSYHSFNADKAQRLNDFVQMVCEGFQVDPQPFEYYLADDYDEIQKLKGFDYYFGMDGSSGPQGKATEGKVYCGGLGEFYPHEVFHVQIDRHYPDKHFWVSEGVATLLGGSRGKSLDWHIKRTHQYLKNHPEMDLKDMLQLTNLDQRTAYHYVLGGLIAKKIQEKGGWPMLRQFMASGTEDEDYYRAIETFLGVERSGLNNYLRAQLAMESGQ